MKATPIKVALESIQEQAPAIRPFFMGEEATNDQPQQEQIADGDRNGFDQLLRGVRIATDEIDMHLEKSSFITGSSSGSKREKKAQAKKKELDQKEFEEMLEEDEVYK